MAESEQTPTTAAVIPEGGIDLTESKDGGVVKVIKKVGSGSGKPQKGNSVEVHYVGTLLDGTKFDSSRDRGEYFSFKLGEGQVIKAWDLGVASMLKGEVCTLTCAAKYAYGEAGSPPKIPPNATLVFEIELFSWSAEDISPDNDKSITRQIIKAGEKYTTPNDGAKVTVRAIGRLLEGSDQPFVDDTFEYTLGEGVLVDLPEGVDKALLRMNKHEHSIIELAPNWAYGLNGSTKLGVPPLARVSFELELMAFEKAKQSWELSIDQKLEEAETLKARGTEFFQQNHLTLALAKYKKVNDLIEGEKNIEDDDKSNKRDALVLAANLNMALVFLKQENTVDCIKHCNSALDVQPNSVKALYRRAQALEKQKDFELAMADYEHVLQVDPENKAAAQQAALMRKKVTEFRNKEKKRMQNMFSKYIEEESAIREKEEALRPKAEEKSWPKAENGTSVDGEHMEEDGVPVVDAAAPAAAAV